MSTAKFVLIGGGSYGWTPTLITDIALNPALKGLHSSTNSEPCSPSSMASGHYDANIQLMYRTG